MDELYKLKEMLCKELEQYGTKGELTGGSLEVVDKLAHAVKNLDKIIEAYEDEEGSYAMGGQGYSREGGYSRDGRYMRDGGSYRGYSRNDGSYARGQNVRRDSMGRYSRRGYSRGGDMGEYVDQLESMMQDLPQEAQQHVQKAIQAMQM